MASYRAEIQIGVVGIGQLGTLQKSLNQVSKTVDILNAKKIEQGFNIQNINTYNAQLQKAWQNINKAAIGSQEELKAVQDLVAAKRNQVAVQERLNKLIKDQEIAQRQIIATRDAGVGLQGPKLPKGFTETGRKPAGGGLGFNPAATAENLALGAGFPLLFGGGAGQVAGGLIGSFFGQGFGGQILGSAIGQQLEDALKRINDISQATRTLNLDALRESVIAVNADLEITVERLLKAGQADAARAAIGKQVALQTGLLPEATAATEQAVSALSTAWNEVVGAVSGLLSIIGRPFVAALAVILQGIAKAIQGTNLLLQIISKYIPALALIDKLWAAITSRLPVVNEEQEKQVASLQRLTESQVKEITNNQKILQLEAQRTLGRTAAEKEINAQIDSQLAKDKIRLEYADKANEIRKEYGNVTTEAGKRELELALAANEALKQQALNQQKIKDLLVQQAAQIEANTEKHTRAAEVIEQQIASLERGNAVTQSRYSAEIALNDLYGAQLQRQYDLAATAKQRFDIAIAMFEQQVKAAQLEYELALNNNALLVEKAKLEANLVVIKYKQLEAEKAIAIAQAASRGNTPEQIKSIADAYDRGLGLQQDAVKAAYDQVQASVYIADNQNKVAEAQLRTKLLAAETALQQKLVSEEIGLSQKQAELLSESLRIVREETLLTTNQAQQIVGVIEVGTERTYIMAQAMSDVAAQAANVVTQIRTAVNEQMRFNAVRQETAPSTTAYAQGGYVTGPTNAMIGEGGESEYVIPASKMSAAMARYASGQRGDSVIPGGNTAGAPGDMGSTSINPMINVTTGPVMNMNGSNYVSQRDFVAGMQAASRRGAEMALSAMRKNGGIRRSVGAR